MFFSLGKVKKVPIQHVNVRPFDQTQNTIILLSVRGRLQSEKRDYLSFYLTHINIQQQSLSHFTCFTLHCQRCRQSFLSCVGVQCAVEESRGHKHVQTVYLYVRGTKRLSFVVVFLYCNTLIFTYL